MRYLKKVFLSSTAKDLITYRDAAKTIIDGLDGFKCIQMENFGARDSTAEKFSVKKVMECDLFIGIIGLCYGSSPENEERSYTEIEYETAIAGKKSRLLLVSKDDFRLPGNLIEPDRKREKQIAFRKKIEEDRIVHFFNNEIGFRDGLNQAITNYVRQKEKQKEPLLFIPHPYPEAPNFTGRKKERAMLTEWLLEDREHPLLSMVAIGGMGKSALAWRWLHEDVLGKVVQLDGIIWWSFYEKGMTFDSFVRSFTASRWGKDSPMLGWTISEQHNAVYQEFQQNKYLIVLDGVERILKAYFGLGSPYQKEDDETLASEKDYRTCIDPNAGIFLTKLANEITQTRTFMTTRLQPKDLDTIAGCRKLDLERLEPEDAVVFFHQQGIVGTRAEIERECEKYGYHPLSLRLLSGLIIEDPVCMGDISRCEVLGRIEDMAPREHNILEIANEALDDTKKEFVSSLAAFRAPISYDAVKYISKYDDERELRDALKEVVNRGIIFQRTEKDRDGKRITIYDLHPIVRSYFYDRLSGKEGVHSNLINYYKSVPKPGIFERVTSLDDFVVAIELYYHTVRAGKFNEALNLFLIIIDGQTFFQFGAYNLQIELLRIAD